MSFANFLGVNTHFGNAAYPVYNNPAIGIKCLQYLGIKHVRDSAAYESSITSWGLVAAATGVKFNAYIGEGSVSFTTGALGYLPALAAAGLLESVEGLNEADSPYSISCGNSLENAAVSQTNVFFMGQKLKLPVINMSFGAGWDKTTGDYGTVGDLTAYCDYANAHTYPELSDPATIVDFCNGLTQLAAKRPVITTEIGWYTGSMAGGVTEQQHAAKLVAALTECQKSGNIRAYIYELLDQKTGDSNPEMNFGLFHSDGTPKAAATAVRNMIAGTVTVSTPSPAPAPAPVVIAAPVINADGSITDPYAAQNPGNMTLDLSVNGSLAQINEFLSQWKGGMAISIWNQAGKNSTKTIIRTQNGL